MKNELDFNNYRYKERVEIGTGAAECTKTKNIYDLAGNMFEWTTEYGKRTIGEEAVDKNLTTNFAVIRGGYFLSQGWLYPVCDREGTYKSSDKNHYISFRIVLYLK